VGSFKTGGQWIEDSKERLQKAGIPVENLLAIIGNPSKITTPRVWEWLKTSKLAAIGWTAMRVWLGIMWIQAGVAKLWGSENPGFMHNGGAGVAGFASHGAAAYSWWGHFLHGFVVPNAGWIGVLVAVAEFVIGCALAIGFFTPLAAGGSLILLFTYVMSGTASVCAFYALFALVLLTFWRTASWIGVDGLILGYRQRHYGTYQKSRDLDGSDDSSGSSATPAKSLKEEDVEKTRNEKEVPVMAMQSDVGPRVVAEPAVS
jgi:thiosulfate dehydrogenase [quinone] large subunit